MQSTPKDYFYLVSSSLTLYLTSAAPLLSHLRYTSYIFSSFSPSFTFLPAFLLLSFLLFIPLLDHLSIFFPPSLTPRILSHMLKILFFSFMATKTYRICRSPFYFSVSTSFESCQCYGIVTSSNFSPYIQ